MAELLAAQGFDLFLAARRQSELDELAAAISSAHGSHVQVLSIDLALPESPERLQAWVKTQGRTLDLLVNNAGYGLLEEVGSGSLAGSLGMIDLNVRALSEITHRFLPDLIQRQGGIINISSLIAYQPMPYMTIYGATKAYVQAYTKMLAYELKGKGVTVTAVCPGYTDTGFQSRAGAEVGDLVKYVPKHSPDKVARDAWAAYGKGKKVLVVGLGNRIMAHLGVVMAPFARLMAGQAFRLAKKHK
jgi:short-subunit dehydrogenase